jgi:hypothetical protein
MVATITSPYSPSGARRRPLLCEAASAAADEKECLLSKHRRQSARRKKRLYVHVTEIELGQIVELAKSVRLSVSSYLRALGQCYMPKSTLDHQAVLTLANVIARQGRLGGLLSLWLSEKPGQGASMADVRRLLHRIETTQAELRQVMRRLPADGSPPGGSDAGLSGWTRPGPDGAIEPAESYPPTNVSNSNNG